MITTIEYTRLLKQTWPKLGQIWIKDTNHIELEPDYILKIMRAIPKEKRTVQGEGWDCDDIARHAMDVVNEHNAFVDGNFDTPTTLYTADGFKWKGEADIHTANVLCYRRQIYCFEPQLLEYWVATAPDDFIYKVG